MESLKILGTKGFIAFLFMMFIANNLWMHYGNGGGAALALLSDDYSIPDLHWTQDKKVLQETLVAFGPQGRMFYLRYQYRDFIYPLIYATLLMSLLIYFIRPKCFNVWVFVPWLAAVFDYGENYYLRLIFYEYPQLSDQHIRLASVFTTLKWSFVLFSLLLVLIAALRRRKKTKDQQWVAKVHLRN